MFDVQGVFFSPRLCLHYRVPSHEAWHCSLTLPGDLPKKLCVIFCEIVEHGRDGILLIQWEMDG